MKLVRPNAEILEQGTTLEDIWKHIARCTRVCYQSEKKDNNESEEEFVKRVILRHEPWSSEANHLAMLEHGTVYLKVGHDSAVERIMYPNYLYNKYSIIRHNQEDNCFYITTNLRVLVENDWLDDLTFICAPTEHHAKRVTVSFATNIGVSREFNRHRVNSIAEESTRYCDYTAGRLQKHNKFALPSWLLDEETLPYVESHKYNTLGSYIYDMWEKDDSSLFNEWCDIDFYLAALTFNSVNSYCFCR